MKDRQLVTHGSSDPVRDLGDERSSGTSTIAPRPAATVSSTAARIHRSFRTLRRPRAAAPPRVAAHGWPPAPPSAPASRCSAGAAPDDGAQRVAAVRHASSSTLPAASRRWAAVSRIRAVGPAPRPGRGRSPRPPERVEHGQLDAAAHRTSRFCAAADDDQERGPEVGGRRRRLRDGTSAPARFDPARRHRYPSRRSCPSVSVSPVIVAPPAPPRRAPPIADRGETPVPAAAWRRASVRSAPGSRRPLLGQRQEIGVSSGPDTTVSTSTASSTGSGSPAIRYPSAKRGPYGTSSRSRPGLFARPHPVAERPLRPVG